MIKFIRLKWVGHVARMEDCRDALKILTAKPIGNFLSLGWETILEGGGITSWPTAWRCGKETGILPHYYFLWKDLIKKEEDNSKAQ